MSKVNLMKGPPSESVTADGGARGGESEKEGESVMRYRRMDSHQVLHSIAALAVIWLHADWNCEL